MTEPAVADLPALDGRDPLGVLAALGILRILSPQAPETRLRWDPVTCRAQLIGPRSTGEVVERLVAAWDVLPTGSLSVGLPGELLPPRGPTGPDPGWLTIEEFRAWFDRLSADPDALDWLRSLWTDLGLDNEGRCARSPFSAPTGKQSLRSMFEKSAALVAADPLRLFSEAVGGWRRVSGFTGENLDIRASRLASEQADGKATTYGVPGATWLALSAIPLFPMGGDGQVPRTVGWYQVQVEGRRRRVSRTVFAWPVWSASLDLEAVLVLLRHPIVGKAARSVHGESGKARDGRRDADELRGAADALQIELVGTATRWSAPGGKSAGYLVAGPTWR